LPGQPKKLSAQACRLPMPNACGERMTIHKRHLSCNLKRWTFDLNQRSALIWREICHFWMDTNQRERDPAKAGGYEQMRKA
jgi:hypothetical protein